MAELNADRIAAAALRVAQERGVQGFTMRAVADALGVTPMALYHHVPDKAGLVALLVDATIGGSALPAPTGVWRDDLWEMARWLRTSAVTNPVVGKLRQAYQVWTPSVFPITERWLSIWQQSGLPLEQAVTAAVTSSMAIVGLVAEESVFQDMDLPDDEMLAMQPGARLVFQTTRDHDADFELLVRSLIDGLYARLRA